MASRGVRPTQFSPSLSKTGAMPIAPEPPMRMRNRARVQRAKNESEVSYDSESTSRSSNSSIVSETEASSDGSAGQSDTEADESDSEPAATSASESEAESDGHIGGESEVESETSKTSDTPVEASYHVSKKRRVSFDTTVDKYGPRCARMRATQERSRRTSPPVKPDEMKKGRSRTISTERKSSTQDRHTNVKPTPKRSGSAQIPKEAPSTNFVLASSSGGGKAPKASGGRYRRESEDGRGSISKEQSRSTKSGRQRRVSPDSAQRETSKNSKSRSISSRSHTPNPSSHSDRKISSQHKMSKPSARPDHHRSGSTRDKHGVGLLSRWLGGATSPPPPPSPQPRSTKVKPKTKESPPIPVHSKPRTKVESSSETKSKPKVGSTSQAKHDSISKRKTESTSRPKADSISKSKPEPTPKSKVEVKSKPKPKSAPKPEKKVECTTCLEEFAVSKIAKLKCEHYMCTDCLRRLFELSTTDPQLMPPKCCDKSIALEHVSKIFRSSFKAKWNEKLLEFKTKNALYCSVKTCSTWIRPNEIKSDGRGRRYGRCSKCETKVCTVCKAKWHGSKPCPNDPDATEFKKMAKEEGWQECTNCKAMVERNHGCNHMICRCGHQFCIVCNGKWKTCDCPWFSQDAIDEDRLANLQNDEFQGDPWGGAAVPLPGLMGFMGVMGHMPHGHHHPVRHGNHAHMDWREEQRREDMNWRNQHLGDDEEIARQLHNVAMDERGRGDEEFARRMQDMGHMPHPMWFQVPPGQQGWPEPQHHHRNHHHHPGDFDPPLRHQQHHRNMVIVTEDGMEELLDPWDETRDAPPHRQENRRPHEHRHHARAHHHHHPAPEPPRHRSQTRWNFDEDFDMDGRGQRW